MKITEQQLFNLNKLIDAFFTVQLMTGKTCGVEISTNTQDEDLSRITS